MNIENAKKIGLVDFLATLGFHPTKINGNDYWYKSPLRKERTASFKVDNSKNLWYDFGTGEGGNIIDFGIRYYRCNVSDLLEILGSKVFSFHPQNRQRQKPTEHTQAAFKILEIGVIKSPRLIEYIQTRGIESEMVKAFCKEIFLQNKNSLNYFKAIGFPNNNGGWELNAPNFKSCIKPKAISFFNEQKNTLAIVEGFFDFLSAKQLEENLLQATNWLVLNSLSMAEKAKPIIAQHEKVLLLLDNDEAGKTCAIKLQNYCAENNIKVENLASKYAQYKDINEWLLKERKLHEKIFNSK
ncbi:toprim domain-containing protein [Arachidicoccus sp.]|uniref:toprim domain-containing protein n=1 Tax=Arachidicoccus sp. TaxID=1872624 RepID=UPI003D2178B8